LLQNAAPISTPTNAAAACSSLPPYRTLYPPCHRRQAAEAARFTAILTNSADTKSASEINAVLAQLFSAVSNKKVDVRQGALLAYIAQLMLQTLKLADPATAHLPQLAR